MRENWQIELKRRAHAQPSTALVKGGDCGPCALGGAIGLSAAQVYRDLRDGEIKALSWECMRRTLYEASSAHLIDRFIEEVPSWHIYEGHRQWGNPSWLQNLAWFKYVSMAVDAGYYGLCSIDSDAKGPGSEHDHWVLVCGARELSVPHATVKGAASIETEILVSCSSKHPAGRWFRARDFLRTRGGFNVLLFRPAA